MSEPNHFAESRRDSRRLLGGLGDDLYDDLYDYGRRKASEVYTDATEAGASEAKEYIREEYGDRAGNIADVGIEGVMEDHVRLERRKRSAAELARLVNRPSIVELHPRLVNIRYVPKTKSMHQMHAISQLVDKERTALNKLEAAKAKAKAAESKTTRNLIIGSVVLTLAVGAGFLVYNSNPERV